MLQGPSWLLSASYKKCSNHKQNDMKSCTQSIKRSRPFASPMRVNAWRRLLDSALYYGAMELSNCLVRDTLKIKAQKCLSVLVHTVHRGSILLAAPQHKLNLG